MDIKVQQLNSTVTWTMQFNYGLANVTLDVKVINWLDAGQKAEYTSHVEQRSVNPGGERETGGPPAHIWKLNKSKKCIIKVTQSHKTKNGQRYDRGTKRERESNGRKNKYKYIRHTHTRREKERKINKRKWPWGLVIRQIEWPNCNTAAEMYRKGNKSPPKYEMEQMAHLHF